MQKKTLVNTLKATKKVNLAAAPAKNEGTSTRKSAAKKAAVKAGAFRNLRKMEW